MFKQVGKMRLLALMIVLGGLWSFAPPTRAATPQLRAFWVDAFHEGYKTPQHTRQLIADAERAGANALIIQVRRRADSYYRDSLEPIASDVAPGYDPLADVITQAHARGIQVHAWAVTYPAWKDNYPQPDQSHVWYQHGPTKPGYDNWFTRDVDGQAGECGGPNECTYFLDPGHPAVSDYIVTNLMHLVQRYDIDGLHLDYVRYSGPRYGYNPTSLARFQQATGRSDKPAPEDAQWTQWRRDQVTKLVKRLYVSIGATKPKVALSVAAIAWGGAPTGDFTTSSPYNRTLQDWGGWLDAGYIDLAIPMVYDREDGGQQQGWYDGWVNYIRAHPGRRAAAVGLGAWLNTPDQNLAQMRRAADAGVGWALYSYAIPTSGDRGAFFDRLRAELWNDGARAPQWSWKTQPTTGHVAGRVLVEGKAGDNLQIRISGTAEAFTTTDGNGFWSVIDLKPGSYRATARNPLTGAEASTNFVVAAGEVAAANFPFPGQSGGNSFSPADTDGAFTNLWTRTDDAVARKAVARSWTWGPQAFATGREPYAEAPGGTRLVQYWDKSRMEITNPDGNRQEPWFVTNGLLTKELISGSLQTGTGAFESRQPAQVPVAGDPNDPNSPTYASFTRIASLNSDRRVAAATGAAVTQTIRRDGSTGSDQALARYNVRNVQYNAEIGHNIPNVFADYFKTMPIDWVFALGYPISEPYWARVQVNGQPQDVLIQVYERRVLTFTPANSATFQVEMGNVGQHYWRWRYGTAPWEK